MSDMQPETESGVSAQTEVSDVSWSWNPIADIDQAAHDVSGFVGRDVIAKIPGATTVTNELNKPYTLLISRPISTFENVFNEADYAGQHEQGQTPGYMEPFHPSYWAKAWDQSANISPGQGLALTVNDMVHPGSLDPYDQAARDKLFQGNPEADVLSGGTDLGFRTLDPVGALGKVASKKVSDFQAKPVTDQRVPNAIIARPDVQRFLVQVPGKSFTELAEDPRFKASPMGNKAAALLSGLKTKEQAEAAYRVAIGDAPAIAKMMADRDQVAATLDKLDRVQAQSFSAADQALLGMRTAAILQPLEVDLQSGLADLSLDDLGDVQGQAGEIVAQHARAMLTQRLKTLDAARDIAGQMTQRTRVGGVANFGTTARAKFSIAQARDGSPFSWSVYDPHTLVTHVKAHAADPLVRLYQTLHDPRASQMVDFSDDHSVNVVRSMLNTFGALTADEKNELTQRYAMADRASRQQVFNNIERTAIRRQGEQYGLTPDQATRIHDEYTYRRSTWTQKVSGRTFGTLDHPAAGMPLGPGAPTGSASHVVADPHLMTQLAQGATPAIDGRDLDLALRRAGETGLMRAVHTMGHSGHQLLTEALDRVYGLWRPLTLITGHRAYNHVGDDALRTMGKLGALATVENFQDGAANFLRNRISRVTRNQQLRNMQAEHDTAVNDARATFRALAARYNSQQGLIAQGVQLSPANLVTVDQLKAAQRAWTSARDMPVTLPGAYKIGQGTFHIPGTQMALPELFGGPDAAYWRRFFSGDRTFSEMFDNEAEGHYNNLLGLAGHDEITPAHGPAAHGTAIIHYVRNQLAPDPVAKMILQGASDNTVHNWMTSTAQGRGVMRALHIGNPMDHIEYIKDQIVKYLPSDTSKEAALNGKYTAKELEHDFPAPSSRPDVLGDLNRLMHLNSPSKNYVRTIANKLIRVTGSLPDDVLVRHPLAATLYKTNMIEGAQRIMAQMGPNHLLTKDELDMLQRVAIGQARETMRGLLYDSTRFTELGNALRFISPFFNAWHNAMTSWSKLFATNPQLLARGLQAKNALWNSPVAVDASTGRPANSKTSMDNLAFVMHLPSALARHLGMSDVNYIPIAASTLISPTYMDSVGNPGFGPLVTVPVNHLVKSSPALIDNPYIKAITGGRISQNDLATAIPSSVTQAENLLALAGVNGSPDNVGSRASLTWSIYQEQMYDYLNGRGAKPNWSDVSNQAAWMAAIDGFVNRVMPLGFKPQGNHRFLIDEYHQMLAEDPKNAQKNFYDKYGYQGFIFTQSLSHDASGIPATRGAAMAYKRYLPLIKQFPEIGAIVVGPEGDGNYSDMAYQWEVANGLRTYMTPQEAATQEQQNLGWIQYGKLMANINAQLAERGLVSVNQSGAQDLKNLRTLFEQASTDPTSHYYNPDWFTAFGAFNQNAYDERIVALGKIAQDDGLLANPARSDIRSLHTYMQARAMAKQYLAGRPSQSLKSSANADVRNWFDYTVGQLVQGDTKFAGIWARYLKDDDLKGG